jgi:predicted enzyme related to lactoylglutathione lyase
MFAFALEGVPMPPTLGNGKICYIALPATDIARSSDFYRNVFDWNIRKRDDGSISFDDGVGEVSGVWTLRLAPTQPGLLIYIMVNSATETIDKIIANSCEIVQPIGGDPGEITAHFRDPGGNILGIYQQHT